MATGPVTVLVGRLSKEGDWIGVALAAGLAVEGRQINAGQAVSAGERALSFIVRGLFDRGWPAPDIERIVQAIGQEAERETRMLVSKDLIPKR